MRSGGGIGVSEEHEALREAAERWMASYAPSSVAREAMDADDTRCAELWKELSAMGWLGLHLPAEVGGEGYGFAELAVVLEAAGRACLPGPFLSTVTASAVIDRFGSDDLRRRVLPDLASGELTAAVGSCSAPATADPVDDETEVSGTWDAVLGADVAKLLVLPFGDAWVVLERDEVEVEVHPSADRTRRVGRVVAQGVAVPAENRFACPGGASGVCGIAALLASAEAVGVTAWCVDEAATYARDREQFGRPIGQFQGVKHRCADMLCRLERARAAVWDAVREDDVGDDAEVALAVAAALSLAPDAAYETAKDCIQVHGGIGFTWEHDAHLYLRRAMTTRLLAQPADAWRREVAQLTLDGVRRESSVDLPEESAPIRAEVRAFLDELTAGDKSEWNATIAESGYLVPHWPEPWGRDAAPLEQLVIDEEFRSVRVRRPHLAVGAWALPTIIVHGTAEQQERWVPPTLRGELTWCQMFSEPGAGSDLASLSTRAVQTDGGWLLTGQKVWTSMAQTADWGICLARTDPDAPKHDGIGCFLVDMATEGVDIRPLKELTGIEFFNEVFLDDVFVPDECVVGDPTGGWSAARTTLGNERVSMGSGSSMGPGVEALLELAGDDPSDPVLETLGAIVAEAQALAAMGTRMTLRALAGAAPGSEASVRKLLGVEHDQRVQEVGLDLLGAVATTASGPAETWIYGFLANRSLSIAGGTSEIQRNVIAERLLDLPKDP